MSDKKKRLAEERKSLRHVREAAAERARVAEEWLDVISRRQGRIRAEEERGYETDDRRDPPARATAGSRGGVGTATGLRIGAVRASPVYPMCTVSAFYAVSPAPSAAPESRA